MSAAMPGSRWPVCVSSAGGMSMTALSGCLGRNPAGGAPARLLGLWRSVPAELSGEAVEVDLQVGEVVSGGAGEAVQ